MLKSRLAAALVILFLSACGSSDSPPMSNLDQRFNNSFFRSGYTFEVFDTGVTDTVSATLSEDGSEIVENGVATDGNQFQIVHLLDAAGRLSSRTTTEADGTVSVVQTFVYGADGLPSQTDFQFADGSTRVETFTWTETDQIDLTMRVNRDAEGIVLSQFSFQFNYVNGILTSMREDLIPNTDGAYRQFNYIVNAQGQVVERAFVSEPGSVAGSRATWVYDANGNQRERINYNSSNERVSRLITTYVASEAQVYNRNLFTNFYMP